MFWSGSGAFIRRHVGTGDAQYFSWTISFMSRLDPAGARRLDVLHLSCSRQPLGPSEERRTGGFEIRLAARDGAGEDGAQRLLCLRLSAQAIDLWIAAAGPAARSGRRLRRRALQPAIDAGVPDGMPLRDGGVIVLDGHGGAGGE
ncbi:hypothetical protein [Inquilinus sp. Marseille-Q2685]|uniref:hypothetical protein n=1 Tax=Inquilinus sp. Marseille-Q2685 TaxID=2866581 RepID=UPI001CE4A2A6|nr:hypothetical protein [Inquilinus sp. Marseille-Q2685]